MKALQHSILYLLCEPHSLACHFHIQRAIILLNFNRRLPALNQC